MARPKKEDNTPNEVLEETNTTEVEPVVDQEQKEEPKEDTVTISREDFNSLLAEIQSVKKEQSALLKQVNGVTDEPTESRHRTAKIRFIGGQLVTGYGQSINKRMPDGNHVLHMEIFTADGEKHLKPYVEFREHGDYEVAEIVDAKKDVEVINKGKIRKKELAKNNWDMVETDEEVPNNVTIERYTFTLKRENGETVELDESAIN